MSMDTFNKIRKVVTLHKLQKNARKANKGDDEENFKAMYTGDNVEDAA